MPDIVRRRLICASGLRARAWWLVLAAMGIINGLFGALRLGVYLDRGLIVGAAALAFVALHTETPRVRRAGPARGAGS